MADGKEADWKAKQDRLLGEIDAFSKAELPSLVEKRPASTHRRIEFPSLDGEPVPERFPLTPSGKPMDTQSFTAQAAPGSLLALLRQQATKLQASQHEVAGQEALVKEMLGDVLQGVYVYLRDLVEQLDVLRPAHPGSYFFNDQITLDGMHWEEGHVDLRRAMGTAEFRPVETVSLQYTLAGPDPIAVVKEYPALETLRKRLLDYGLRFDLMEQRNNSGQVVNGRFSVRREVRGSLSFAANPGNGNILLKAANIERLGTATYAIPPEALGPSSLEAIGLMMLGESMHFLRGLVRTG